jgi:hypothetical protein
MSGRCLAKGTDGWLVRIVQPVGGELVNSTPERDRSVRTYFVRLRQPRAIEP